MSEAESDALVFLGATGDLAYKNIFPALQAMVKCGDRRHPRRRSESPVSNPGKSYQGAGRAQRQRVDSR